MQRLQAEGLWLQLHNTVAMSRKTKQKKETLVDTKIFCVVNLYATKIETQHFCFWCFFCSRVRRSQMLDVLVLVLVRFHVLHGCEACLNALPKSLKSLWRWFTVERWTFASWATALVDIPACQLLHAPSKIMLWENCRFWSLPLVYLLFTPFFCVNRKSFWVQFMKIGSKIKSVAFLFLFSVAGQTLYIWSNYFYKITP